eukprot:m.153398 g.153398  ORF g.153398 m.153398 type:complete len:87 (+) comp15065_c0_seq4:165-425(+)
MEMSALKRPHDALENDEIDLYDDLCITNVKEEKESYAELKSRIEKLETELAATKKRLDLEKKKVYFDSYTCFVDIKLSFESVWTSF